MKTQKQIIGKLGEDFACEYLRAGKYEITERNYLRKWGEIDIIGKKEGIIHFVEVKTVTRKGYTNNIDRYRAEDNVHLYKTERLRRAIQTYILDRKIKIETMWQFDLITVLLNKNDGEVLHVEHIEDLII